MANLFGKQRLLFITAAAFLLMHCSKNPGPGHTPDPSPTVFRGVRVYIISLGDVHEYSLNLAQYRSLVRGIRDTASHVYTVMAGDFFMVHRSYNVTRCDGNTDQAVKPDLKVPGDSNQRHAGLAMLRLMEYFNFDAVVPGNHDWIYGIDMLRNKVFKDKLVGCNISDPSGLTTDYISISSVSGRYTINFSGVACNDNVHAKPGETVTVHPISSSTSQKRIKSALTNGDIKVLVTHLTNKDDQYAYSTFTDSRGQLLFDALCGGHTHASEAKLVSGSGYVKAGLYGTYAGLTCIWWDTVKLQVSKRSTKLLCLENITPDPETTALIDSLHRVYAHYP